VRRALLGLALAAALAAAAPAQAGTLTTRNACLYAIDGYWRDLDLTLAGAAAPDPAAPGAPFTLGGASLRADLPSWIPRYGYNLGMLVAGRNEIPARVWVALAGTNAAPAAQVVELATTAVTTITVVEGQPQATPISVTVPVPDTGWTAGAAGTAGVAQAGAGTLPPLPLGPGGTTIAPQGSVYVRAELNNSARFDLDCQPGRSAKGTTDSGSDSFTAQPAQPFALLGVGAALPPPPAADPHAGRPMRIRSTVLRRRGRRVGVAVTCLTRTRCAGRVRVRRGGRLLAGGRYVVAAGRRATVRVRLTAAGRRALRSARSVRVRLTVDPAAGRTVARTLRLRS